jgi:hypothetical protein
MKTTSQLIAAAILATLAVGFSTVARANPAYPYFGNNDQKGEKLIFVTGSLIPQRVKIKPIGTATTSPMRTYDRNEIDSLGRIVHQSSNRVRESAFIIGCDVKCGVTR